MGKLMVAEGLGLCVLPDYSVIGDPLHRAGLITHRPIAEHRTTVSLVLLEPQDRQISPGVRDLRERLLRHARSYAETGAPAWPWVRDAG